MRSRLLQIGLLVLFLSCAFLAFRGTPADQALFLYCGAGLRPAMEDLRQDFTQRTGIPVLVSYAGSGCLLSMLTFARSGDLYMPGERYYVDQAREEGHLKEDVTAAYFVAVVMVQKGNPKGIHSLRDLAREDVRVGIGHPDSVACGLVAKKILEKAGLWEAVKANIDARGAYTGAAMELSNALSLKALDAAINWDAMAFPVLKDTDILTIPREANVDVPVPLAVLTWTQQQEAAARFVEFALSEAGRAHFAKHGYHTAMEPYVLPYYGTAVLE
jgi:molybdate transport system substrate-binding protein